METSSQGWCRLRKVDARQAISVTGQIPGYWEGWDCQMTWELLA